MNKKILILFLGVICFNVSHAQANSGEVFANKIANKMKDSLFLTDEKRGQIFAINMDLYNQKQAKRTLYPSGDSLRYHLQIVENKRDSLYQSVLTQQEFLLYKQKKRNLINNN